MSKTIEIRKAVHEILCEVCLDCYYRKAPDNVKMPYITYSIGNFGPAAYLKLDLWDHDSDSSVIEDLADKFEKVLHRLTFSNEEVTLSFYCERDRQQQPDDDRSVVHLIENYSMKYYGKEEI